MAQILPPELIATIFTYKYTIPGIDMTINDVIFIALTLKKNHYFRTCLVLCE